MITKVVLNNGTTICYDSKDVWLEVRFTPVAELPLSQQNILMEIVAVTDAANMPPPKVLLMKLYHILNPDTNLLEVKTAIEHWLAEVVS